MERTKKIESYLDGSMEPAERDQLERSAAVDPELASDIKLSQEVNNALLDEGTYQFRAIVRNVINNSSDPFKKVFKALKYPMAASIALLIGLSFWQILTDKSAADLYTLNYKPYQTDISTRSGNENQDNTNLAFEFYQEGNYKTSFDLLQTYLSLNSGNQMARFYSGLNAIEIGMYNLAIEELKQVEIEKNSPFFLHAQWYLAMIYLQLNQPADSKFYLQQLIANENLYTEQAREILKKLKV
jgi:hypothetical protein